MEEKFKEFMDAFIGMLQHIIATIEGSHAWQLIESILFCMHGTGVTLIV